MAHISIHANHDSCSFHADNHAAHQNQGVLPKSGFVGLEMKQEQDGVPRSQDRITFHVQRDHVRQMIDALQYQYSRVFIDPYEEFCKQHGCFILGPEDGNRDGSWVLGDVHGNQTLNYDFRSMESAMDAVVEKVQNGEWPAYVRQYLDELAAQDNFREQCALAQKHVGVSTLVSDEWSRDDQESAIAVGWGIFRNGEHTEIQRVDDPIDGLPSDGSRFASDQEARDYVAKRANQGSLFCQRALRVVNPSPSEQAAAEQAAEDRLATEPEVRSVFADPTYG